MTACPLCPGVAPESVFQPELLGMFVCSRCAERWRIGWQSALHLPDVSAVAWCIQVHREKLKHMVSVRTARRLVMAEHLGLEVDADDLRLDGRLPWTT